MNARTETILQPRELGVCRVLAVDGETLWAARGFALERSLDGGLTFETAARVRPTAAELPATVSTLAARFLRAGFHHLLPLEGGVLLGVLRGRIVRVDTASGAVETVHRVERGTRPLSLCRSTSGRVYFGEYFGNPLRDEVRIYGSDDDGLSFDVAHVFPAGGVRHVHGVHADPIRRGTWVLTGDEGNEVGVWWTGDDFATLEPVLRGEQRARAVALLPTREGLVLPTDTPQETNRVQLLDPRSGRLDTLGELPGSCFHAARADGALYLSTAVEKSATNTDPRAALFASTDGTDWRPVAHYRRDLPLLNDRRGYLQYPTLLLPSGASRLPYLFATGQALSGLHGRLLRWSVRELRDVVGATDARAA